jgi:hypothetical protein
MTAVAAIILPPFELDHRDLPVATLPEDLGTDQGISQGVAAHDDLTLSIHQQD